MSAVAELLRLIERLYEISTKVQGMVLSPHLAMTLLYNVLHQWILYLNRCVTASESEALESLGDNVPFLIDPILV